MYKVMIIDDEEIVRDGIRDLIEWEDEGFTICAEGKDGREGLENILEYQPHLVLVDIKMPGLSGIQVIQAARDKNFNGQFIILTGYSEFEFAQSAIRLGVKDYLLKPIDDDELLSTVRQIKKDIEDKEQLKHYHSGNEEQARESMLRRVLLHLEPRDQLEEDLGRYNLDLEADSLCAAMCWERQLMGSEENSQFYELINELSGADSACCGRVMMNGHMVLIAKDIEYSKWIERLTRNNERLKAKYGSSLLIAVGHNVRKWYDLCFSYEMARYLMEHVFLFSKSRVLSPDIIQEQNMQGKEVPVEQFEMLIEIGELEAIRDAVSQYRDYCALSMMKESDMKVLVTQNLMMIKTRLEKKYGQERFSDSAYQKIIREMLPAESIDALFEYYTTVLQDMCRHIGNLDSDTVIKKILRYMEMNYDKDLKLETIARLFNYNSAYLGQIFRKEMGERFNNVLDTIRINNAKKLLSGTEMKVYQVSEQVGFSNIDYFYMKFKKYVGISPKEYRKKYVTTDDKG